MLGLAKRTKARFLITSTSEVYGDPAEHPQREEYWGNVNCIGIRACYDEGKRVAETLTYGYQRQDNVDVRVARIFNTFGPRMNPYDGRVVSNFIIQALKGEDMTVYGDGSQTRSFQYVHDLVDGLILLMNGPETRPVNIGNGDEFTIIEFAEAVRVSHDQFHCAYVRISSSRCRKRRATPWPRESTSSTRTCPRTTRSVDDRTPPGPRRLSNGSQGGLSGKV
jgi:nucleoside-diphosphate-sugar epimerase